MHDSISVDILFILYFRHCFLLLDLRNTIPSSTSPPQSNIAYIHTYIDLDSVFNSWLKCLCLENSRGHKYSGMVNFGRKTFSDFVVLFKLGLFRAIGNIFKMGQHTEQRFVCSTHTT